MKRHGIASGTLSPVGYIGAMWRLRSTIWSITKREVVWRYKGSALGALWALIHPLLLLGIYTLVFGAIIGARWGGAPQQDAVAFAQNIFTGLIVHIFFSECIVRSSQVMHVHRSLVKKSMFPTEALPIGVACSALFHFILSFGVLTAFALINRGNIHVEIIFAPVVIVPMILVMFGIGWIMAVIGACFRDIEHALGFITTAALFLSPVFYPLDSVPASLRPVMLFNPLTLIIEELRKSMNGTMPDFTALAVYFAAGCVLAWFGYWIFMTAKKYVAEAM